MAAPTRTEAGLFVPGSYQSLDHWRGVAALAVMMFHGFGAVRTTAESVHASMAWLKYLADFGWFGVHIFFVVSGYCIAANVHRRAQANSTAWVFCRDRILRIYPAYWTACIVTIAVNVAAWPFNRLSPMRNLPATWGEALAGLLLLEPYLGINSALLMVSWSLVYEIGFYIIVAVGFALFRAGVRFNLLAAVAVALALCGLWGANKGAFYVLKYWPEFVCGGAIFAIVSAGPRRSIAAAMPVAILVLFVAAASVAPDAGNRLPEMVGAASFAAILLVLHRWDAGIASLSGLKWLAWIGTFSYSLYLIHVPVGGRVINLALRMIPEGSPLMWAVEIVYWSTCLASGYAFYRLCERPLESWRRRLNRGTVSRAGAGLAQV